MTLTKAGLVAGFFIKKARHNGHQNKKAEPFLTLPKSWPLKSALFSPISSP